MKIEALPDRAVTRPQSTPFAIARAGGRESDLDERLTAPVFDWPRDVLLGGAGVVTALLLAGWLFLNSYYDFFHMPTGGLGITLPEVFTAGAHALLFPLLAVPGAYFIRHHRRLDLRGQLLAVAATTLVLALLAEIVRWYGALDIAVQSVAVLWVGLVTIFIARLKTMAGSGVWARVLIVASALLLVLSVPTALGSLAAHAQATAMQGHLQLISARDLGIPGARPNGGRFQYDGYVLVRESATQYWVMRAGRPSDVYSVPRSELIVRY